MAISKGNFLAGIEVFLLLHFVMFIITSIYASYMRIFNLKESIFQILQESNGNKFFIYFCYFLLLMRSIFEIKIEINLTRDIIFAILFCMQIIYENKNNENFNKKIFIIGQLIFVVIVGFVSFFKFST